VGLEDDEVAADAVDGVNAGLMLLLGIPERRTSTVDVEVAAMRSRADNRV